MGRQRWTWTRRNRQSRSCLVPARVPHLITLSEHVAHGGLGPYRSSHICMLPSQHFSAPCPTLSHRVPVSSMGLTASNIDGGLARITLTSSLVVILTFFACRRLPRSNTLLRTYSISCKTLTVLSSPSSDQPARRGTKSATSSESCTSSVLLAPEPWCVVFHLRLLAPHQLFSVADAPSNYGHGDRDRDVVSFLLGMESLSLRTRTCDVYSIF
jgi:hypothetical protein